MTAVEAAAYLTPKSGSQKLGVHEQTLRSWEKRGLIRMICLPGSGYRRVPVGEVERLQDEMATPPPGPGVQLIPPRGDPEARAEALALAEAVRAELANLESTTTIDEFMASCRGRTGSP